ncbi:MAG: DUF2249 domain-containing protein [Trueperaceae bacterium]
MTQKTDDPTLIPPTGEVVTDPAEALAKLSRLFDESLRGLGDAGEKDAACDLAARAWTLLRHTWPKEGERFNGTLHYLTRTPKKPAPPAGPTRDLDVRHMPPAQRHETIFVEWNALEPGAGYVLVNDHDPKPLYYQFAAEHPGEFTWDEIEMGPTVWRVRIGRT